MVFYDYDEIEYMTDCNFRKIPPYISGNSMPVSAYSTRSIGTPRSIISRRRQVLSLPPLRLTA